MFCHLDFVLSKEGRAVKAEEVLIGEIDVPLNRVARREAVIKETRARLELIENTTDIQTLGQQRRRPSAVTDLASMHAANRAGYVEYDALVWVAHIGG